MGADLLHPVVLHHVANTLQWPALRPLQEQAIAAGARRARRAAARAHGGRQDGGGCAAAALGDGAAAVAAGCPCSTSVRCGRCSTTSSRASTATPSGSAAGLQLWHGDTGEGRRNQIRRDPPDILLTTPESLEAMLVSTKMESAEFFATVRAVVVDEVHAFAGDDRGWHLLAVLERLSRLAGRPLQRIGLSATVGNPDELLTWLQGSAAGVRPAAVVAPGVDAATAGRPTARPPGEVTLDHVGSLDNAAKVIAALHAGEKRLVFCESRRAVEELAHDLRVRGVQTFVSHSSLSVDERRRAEQAFAEARDCVIVSTSTLELGIDVGDLDRVIQIDSPRTVASFLQRIGRTGRRPGTTRNALFLTTDDGNLLQAAALLLLWARGFVEPVVRTSGAPPHRRPADPRARPAGGARR